jgi:hypothetical protein
LWCSALKGNADGLVAVTDKAPPENPVDQTSDTFTTREFQLDSTVCRHVDLPVDPGGGGPVGIPVAELSPRQALELLWTKRG